MKKNGFIILSTVILMLIMSFSAFAGEWKQEADGRWWYRHDDGGYTTSNWEFINGKYYYFDAQGWMLANTTTPDGYYVGADGAWVQSGATSTGTTASTAQNTSAASSASSGQIYNAGSGAINVGYGVTLYLGTATEEGVRKTRGVITLLDGKMLSGPTGKYGGKLTVKYQGTVTGGGTNTAVDLVAYDSSGYELSWHQLYVRSDESGQILTDSWHIPKGTSYIKIRGR